MLPRVVADPVRMDVRVPIQRRHLFATVLGAFLLSRMIVFAATLLPLLVAPDADRHSPQDRVLVALSYQRIGAALERLALSGDAGWYRDIAANGYAQRPFDANAQANWAFFPAHPMLWRGVDAVLGSATVAGIVLANACLLLALGLLYLLARGSGRDDAASARAVYALALFPVAYFLSFPWSESLFLVLSLGAMLAAQRGAWWWAGLFGAGSAATRFAGLFLASAMLAQVLRERRRPTLHECAAIAMVPLGLLGFMAMLWSATGHPLAFAEVQSAWGRETGLPLRAIGIVLLRPWEIAVDWNVRWLNLGALLLGLLALRHFLVRREFGFAVFLGLGLLAPLLTDTLTSMARYVLGLFPVVLAIADWTTPPAVERAWFALSVTALVLMSAAFGLGYSFALT